MCQVDTEGEQYYIMGQRVAKQQIEEGLRLYHEHDHEGAVRKWKNALRKITDHTEKFLTLGYLLQIHDDCGKYREMLEYSLQQIEVGNIADNSCMRAEAYLNLARSNERLAEYEKALSYGKNSLQHPARDPLISGHTHYCLGNSYYGFSNFSNAIDHYEHAGRIAKQNNDAALEILVYTGIGNIYMTLKDFDKGLLFFSKASELSRGLPICNMSSKYQRLTNLGLSTPLRKLGRLTEAMDCCEDAMKMALEVGDRPVQAKCLCCFADIHRTLKDVDRAYPRYEAALSIMIETGDRFGQAQVLTGMAKTFALMRQLSKICECKALEINFKALETATTIGNKLFALRCHLRIEELYRSLGDQENVRQQMQLTSQLVEDIELYCGICGQSYGFSSCKLEILPCSHIFHSNCLNGYNKRKRNCPDCRKTIIKPAVYV